MSVDKWIGSLSDQLGDAGPVLGGLILIVIVLFGASVLAEQYPEIWNYASPVIGIIAVVVILIVCLPHLKDLK